jgi:hypothetical protein
VSAGSPFGRGGKRFGERRAPGCGRTHWETAPRGGRAAFLSLTTPRQRGFPKPAGAARACRGTVSMLRWLKTTTKPHLPLKGGTIG